ncbi:uncharacterized protein LOC110866858 [Helianthus annuus]|uniref:uncharacterized protein LOC110866858 n=1 Tax=Helianthus annuus TaxID=4232 RepID=UPI000B8F20D5|nr:uncharacterized protein LOC110866858 [Helianthus annuus]
MEALHVATVTTNAQGLFKGCKLPNNGPTISHLLYADDVLFVGEWPDSNIHNLARILRCFNLASGLKVNFNKSQLFGIGLNCDLVEQKASILQCKMGVLPFTYLGLPVGLNMGLVKNWKPIIDRFEDKLSIWKARTLSFGGRVTLIQAVLGNLPSYYLSLFSAPSLVLKCLEGIRRKFLWGGCTDKNKICWAPWHKVVAPKNNGGMGIGSLDSLNKSLMIKWAVRFKNEPTSLWASVISAIHGGGRCLSYIPLKSSISGAWKSIVNMGRFSPNQPIKVQERLTPIIGIGDKVSFWLDNWAAEVPLRVLFPNLFAIETEKQCKVMDRYTYNQGKVVWFWGSEHTISSNDLAIEWGECLAMIEKVNIQLKYDIWQWKTGAEAGGILRSVSSDRSWITSTP